MAEPITDFKGLARFIGVPVDSLADVFDAIGAGDLEAAEAAMDVMDGGGNAVPSPEIHTPDSLDMGVG